MPSTCSITAVFPAYERVKDTLNTLSIIKACDPAPAEIIVHVDGGARPVADAVAASHPDVRILTTNEFVGPGGARNRLIEASSHELVANFDDDSHPWQPDYFARVMATAARFPNAAIISAASQESEWNVHEYQSIAIASGCGCVFRKSWFQHTAGFVPLRIAYCMEEVDLSLQIHAMGGQIVHDPCLRVQHDHELSDGIDPEINATVIANTALFAFLRYPQWMWPAGVWQVFRRVAYLVARGWTRGIGRGLRMIPGYVLKHRSFRKTIPAQLILSWAKLRRHPVNLGPVSQQPAVPIQS